MKRAKDRFYCTLLLTILGLAFVASFGVQFIMVLWSLLTLV